MLPQRSASSTVPSVWLYVESLPVYVTVSRSEQPFPQVEDSSALTMLEEVITVESRQDVAMTLVKIYLGQGLVVPFLDYLNTREVQHTSKSEYTAAVLPVLEHITSTDFNFQSLILFLKF